MTTVASLNVEMQAMKLEVAQLKGDVVALTARLAAVEGRAPQPQADVAQSVKAAIEPLLQASQKDKTVDTMILTINNNKTPFNFKKTTPALQIVNSFMALATVAKQNNASPEAVREALCRLMENTKMIDAVKNLPNDEFKFDKYKTCKAFFLAYAALEQSLQNLDALTPNDTSAQQFVDRMSAFMMITRNKIDYEMLARRLQPFIVNPTQKITAQLGLVGDEQAWRAWCDNDDNIKYLEVKYNDKRNIDRPSNSDHKSDEDDDDDEILMSTSVGCDVDAQIRRRDGTMADVIVSIDTKAHADFISRRCADDNDIEIDASRRRNIIGATPNMREKSDGMATFELITPSGTLRIEAVVLNELNVDVVIGTSTMQQLGTTIVASPSGFNVSWDGMCIATTSGGGDKTDETTIMSCDVPAAPTFKYATRARTVQQRQLRRRRQSHRPASVAGVQERVLAAMSAARRRAPAHRLEFARSQVSRRAARRNAYDRAETGRQHRQDMAAMASSIGGRVRGATRADR